VVTAALAGSGCSKAEDVSRNQQAGSGGMNGASGSGGGSGDSGSGGGSGDSGSGGGSGDSGQGGQGGTGGERVFDAGSDPDRNDVTAGELCDRLSTIQCAGEAFCCDNPGRDFNACKQEMQNGCEDQLMFDAIASSEKAAFSAEHAKLAYGEIERLASECDPSVAEFGQSVDGLRGMFKGTVGPNGSCTTFNLTRRDEVAKALASCLDPANNSCLPESAIGWSCAPRAAAGGNCFTDVNCQEGLYCPNPNFDIAGATCTARKAVDAPCSLPNECESLFCKGGKCVDATTQAAYCLSAN
jgi:hypothetical protein